MDNEKRDVERDVEFLKKEMEYVIAQMQKVVYREENLKENSIALVLLRLYIARETLKKLLVESEQVCITSHPEKAEWMIYQAQEFVADIVSKSVGIMSVTKDIPK
jgi:hypothetical protein